MDIADRQSAEGGAEGATPAVERALALARARLGERADVDGEPLATHAAGMIAILEAVGADEPTRVAAALFADPQTLPGAAIVEHFGEEAALLVDGMRELLRVQAVHRAAAAGTQLEDLRRMLLAMGADIRVVLLRLASRLQTLRWHASVRKVPDAGVSRETLEVLAPLANRLGLWQMKWELEDYAFRFLEPATYRALAAELEGKRSEREAFVAVTLARLRAAMQAAGVRCEVAGRAKHLYSIWQKMRAKGLPMSALHDLRAFRVIVEDTAACYAALDVVHRMWTPVPEEYDDYIARPKPNGYQSLHTVVLAEDGRSLEVQIRTRAMHERAEYGVASHWRYKEGTGAAPTTARDPAAERIAWARALLAWQREVGAALGSPAGEPGAGPAAAPADDRIYVLTPQGRIVDLPQGSTPVDFAYHLHTTLGHRCRGAKVDGQMVALDTPLANGQTVEIIAAKAGPTAGPSRDWLNPQLGYLRSPRARQKVRAWFNAQDHARAIATGRERVEKALAREGRTALSFETLAHRLGFPDPAALFLAVAKEELVSPRQLEEAIRNDSGQVPQAQPDGSSIGEAPVTGGRRTRGSKGADVLVVGVGSLLTQLARCCRPIPPDPIVGFVTLGKGVSVHRSNCPMFKALASRAAERVIETAWSSAGAASDRYPADMVVQAHDRAGLLRDVLDVVARNRVNVAGVKSMTRAQIATIRITLEVADAERLRTVASEVRTVAGVFAASRASA